MAPLIIDYLTTDQGGTVKQVLVEDGAMVKRGQKLIILSNPALQLQVAAQQITFEQTRFKYQHDLLDIEHQISQLKSNLARDKILLDGNAIAPSTYRQEQQEDYDYYLKLREATIASARCGAAGTRHAAHGPGRPAHRPMSPMPASMRSRCARQWMWPTHRAGCRGRPVQNAGCCAFRAGQLR